MRFGAGWEGGFRFFSFVCACFETPTEAPLQRRPPACPPLDAPAARRKAGQSLGPADQEAPATPQALGVGSLAEEAAQAGRGCHGGSGAWGISAQRPLRQAQELSGPCSLSSWTLALLPHDSADLTSPHPLSSLPRELLPPASHHGAKENPQGIE